MTQEPWDVAVLGGGPAGGNAALSAARAGARVVLIDDQQKSGGQVWRAKSDAILEAPSTPEGRAGDALREVIAGAAITQMPGSRVWTIERDGDIWSLRLVRDGKSATLTTRQLILAPGAREYVQPFPGWTTPGVIGLAGATALMKRDQMPPGQSVVVCGTGPLVFFVATEIRRLGGDVRAVVTPNSRADWMRALPAMIRQPGLAFRGVSWLADLTLGRVPIYWNHAVTGAHGGERIDSVEIKALGAVEAPIRLDTDALCVGHGLLPNIEPARLAGASLARDPVAGTWTTETGESGATSLPGLYVCGDATGIRGAMAAEVHGQIAGAEAAAALGHGQGASDGMMRRLRKARRFGAAMTALSRPGPDLAALTTPDTIVCRCESITRATIEAEVATGADSMSAVKSGLRAGMGACGGRFCGQAVAEIIARARGIDPGALAPPTARPPLAPVPLEALAGEFRYEDLPIRKPAPL